MYEYFKVKVTLHRYANAPQDAIDLTSLPIPRPPINKNKVLEDDDNFDIVNRCPICRSTRKNETLLPTSGYVFCYKCICLLYTSDDAEEALGVDLGARRKIKKKRKRTAPRRWTADVAER